jgi:hypothetical protein
VLWSWSSSPSSRMVIFVLVIMRRRHRCRHMFSHRVSLRPSSSSFLSSRSETARIRGMRVSTNHKITGALLTLAVVRTSSWWSRREHRVKCSMSQSNLKKEKKKNLPSSWPAQTRCPGVHSARDACGVVRANLRGNEVEVR